MGVRDLKGGMNTRKGSKTYNKSFESITKDCGCMLGSKCDCRRCIKGWNSPCMPDIDKVCKECNEENII